ncbi:MAG: hypothetical protein U5L09_09540 [Bacteroidales bacterium]|nr:hypothetical protein [Bacteroidales bacterium]
MRIQRIPTKEPKQEQNGVDLSVLDPVIEKYKGTQGNLIPLLQAAQRQFRISSARSV